MYALHRIILIIFHYYCYQPMSMHNNIILFLIIFLYKYTSTEFTDACYITQV